MRPDGASIGNGLRIAALASEGRPTIDTIGGPSAPRARDDALPMAQDPSARAWDLLTEASGGDAVWRHLLLPPGRLLRLRRAARALPVLTVSPSRTANGCAVRDQLRIARTGRVLLAGLTSGLRIPAAPGEYEQGSSKQTVRRKERAATRAGVTWSLVQDRDERLDLKRIADAFERRGSRGYRTAVPHNDDLFAHDLWLVARDAEGAPLLLSVTPVDGPVATLRYFRTLDDSQAASDARYLVTRVLIDELAGRGGIEMLVDTAGVQWLSPGLRHFQRMLGFRLFRLRVRGARTVGHHPACPERARRS